MENVIMNGIVYPPVAIALAKTFRIRRTWLVLLWSAGRPAEGRWWKSITVKA
jgi:hypothetical protein